MNETKHTPGPWFVQADLASGLISVFDNDGMTIAMTPRLEDMEVRGANACLMAAAPGLLSFAESFVAWIDTLRKIREPKDTLPGLEAREREARAALAAFVANEAKP